VRPIFFSIQEASAIKKGTARRPFFVTAWHALRA
jgi:hypothetical protein